MNNINTSDFFISEIKEIFTTLKITREDAKDLLDAALLMEKLFFVARREGFLALCGVIEYDDEFYSADDFSDIREKYDLKIIKPDTFEKHLSDMLDLVTNGTDIDYILDICSLNYYSFKMTNVEKIKYLLYLKCCLMIRAGESFYYYKLTINAILPQSIKAAYLKHSSQQEKAMEKHYHEVMEKNIEIICDVEKYPYSESHVNKCFRALSNADIQKLVNDVLVNELALALCGLPGELRKKFIMNTSLKKREDLVDKMMFYMSNEEISSKDAIDNVFSKLEKLEESGDVHIW